MGHDQVCGNGVCDQPAAAVAYARDGGSVLIRTDHLYLRPEAAADARCIDCLLELVREHVDAAPVIADPGAARQVWLKSMTGPITPAERATLLGVPVS